MRAATTHSSGTTLFTFTALKCAITPIHEVGSLAENLSLGCVGSPKSLFSMALGPLTGAGVGVRVL